MGTKPLKENPEDVPESLRCMNPDCNHAHPRAVSLGICQRCYGRFSYWIKKTKLLPPSKRITWKKLANKGVCKEKANAITRAMSRKQ